MGKKNITGQERMKTLREIAEERLFEVKDDFKKYLNGEDLLNKNNLNNRNKRINKNML